MTIRVDPTLGGLVTSQVGNSPSAPSYVDSLRFLGAARQLTVTSTSNSVELTSGTYALRLFARACDARFSLGGPTVLAYATVSHWLPKGTEVSFRLNTGETHLAAIRSHLETSDGVLEITELQVE